MSLKEKAQEILEGYKNQVRSSLGITTEDEEKFFKEREDICKKCPSLTLNGTVCGECTCPIIVKSKSFLSDCPLKKWSDVKYNDKIVNYGR